jgi:cytidylate kinase
MDGPSGTGKSTVSRRLALAGSAAYLDTGAMYRALTLAVLRAGLEGSEPAAESVALAAVPDLRSVVDPGAPRILLTDEDVEAEIRGPEVTAAVSAVSAVPAVRAALVSGSARSWPMRSRPRAASWWRAATSAASWCRMPR